MERSDDSATPRVSPGWEPPVEHARVQAGIPPVASHKAGSADSSRDSSAGLDTYDGVALTKAVPGEVQSRLVPRPIETKIESSVRSPALEQGRSCRADRAPQGLCDLIDRHLDRMEKWHWATHLQLLLLLIVIGTIFAG